MVASEGSFANAAERIGVTQPTVSEQVKALERTLGVLLFERQPSGLRLTEEGRVAFEQTTVMFRASDHLRSALELDKSAHTSLRVGISAAIGRATRADFLLPLTSLPNCFPTIRSGDTTDLLRDLRASELDLVIVESEPAGTAKRGLEVVRLASITLVAVTSRSSQTSDWSNLGLITYRTSSAFRSSIDAHLEANSLRPKLVAEADDALFLLEAARRDGHVAFVPSSLAQGALDTNRLRSLGTVDVAPAGVYAIVPDEARAELARHAVRALATAQS